MNPKDRYQPIAWDKDRFDALKEAFNEARPGATVFVQMKVGFMKVAQIPFRWEKAAEIIDEYGAIFAEPEPVFPENREGEEP